MGSTLKLDSVIYKEESYTPKLINAGDKRDEFEFHIPTPVDNKQEILDKLTPIIKNAAEKNFDLMKEEIVKISRETSEASIKKMTSILSEKIVENVLSTISKEFVDLHLKALKETVVEKISSTTQIIDDRSKNAYDLSIDIINRASLAADKLSEEDAKREIMHSQNIVDIKQELNMLSDIKKDISLIVQDIASIKKKLDEFDAE